MRGKIIAVNAGILLLVGLLTYALLASSLAGVLQNQIERKQEVGRSLRGAAAQLALDGLRVERWLSTRTTGKDVRAVYAGGTESARQEAATVQANELYKAAIAEPNFERMAPNLVLFVDARGVAMGRNGSNLMRGEKIADAHPSLAEALKTGVTTSDLWVHRGRQEQWLASYAPVHGDDGNIVGAVIVGTPLTDDRLARTSELSSGYLLFAAVVEGERLELLANSRKAPPAVVAGVTQPAVAALARTAIEDRKTSGGDVTSAGHIVGVTPLIGYGSRGVLVAAVPASLVASLAGELWPVFAVTALGLILVIVAGYLLGNYFQSPIGQIEEGLLAIINGRTDIRFELEHAELGGLVFRINSLLNALMGVPEDTTDEHGRPSAAPSAGHFQDALGVDESSIHAQNVDPGYAEALAAEPDDAYYERVFRDYLAAKREVGDPVEHITRPAFTQKLQQSEAEVSRKHGRPVRYRVEVRGNAVVLIAIPLRS
ncbi:MAG: hypothetical protein JW751_09020 [Polyangiaceae bacterium]|nr:hypothetical protein [Polyangiaceae bacterium]